MKNKNIIKALAIGISASMALQPVTVLAEADAQTTPDGDAAQTQGSEQEQSAQQNVFDGAKADTQYAENAIASTNQVESIVNDDTSVDSAMTETKNEKDLVSTIPGVQADTQDPVGKLETAKNELIEAQGNVQNAETAIDAAKTADGNAAGFAASNKAQDAKDDIIGENGAAQIAIEGLDHTVDVDEFTNTEKANAVYDAGQASSNIEKAKNDASDASDKYQSAIDGAQAYNPSTDTTGQILEQIKKDAADANTSLEDAKADLVQAQADLTKAQTEFDEADTALGVAETSLALAKAEYDNLFVTDENGDFVLDKDGNRIEKTQKQIDLAKAALVAAQEDFDAAVAARNTAKTAVQDEVNKLNSAKYDELLALKNAVDAAEGDEAKQKAQKDFQEALIKYYFIGEDTTNLESITFGQTTFAGLGNNVVMVDGVAKYVKGYEKELDAEGNETGRYRKDENGNYIPVLENLPSVISVTYKMKDATEETVKRYSITSKEDGSFEIAELTEAVVSTGVTETINTTVPAHYEKDGQTVTVADTETVVEINDDGKKTGAYVTTVNDDNKIYEYEVDGQVPADTRTVQYVKNESESGKTKDPSYGSATVTTQELVGYETYDDVKQGDGDTHAAIEEAEKAHKEAGNYIKTQAYNHLYVPIISDLLGIPEWIDIEVKDGKVGLVGILAEIIDEKVFQDILKFKTDFRVVYSQPEVTDIPIYKDKEETKSGIVVETYDTYEKEVWGVTKEEVRGDKPEARVKYDEDWFGNPMYYTNYGLAQAEINSNLKKNSNYSGFEVKAVYETDWCGNIIKDWKGRPIVIGYYITYTETIHNALLSEAEYGWVKTGETVKVTTSKKMYQADQYNYVAESTSSTTKTVGTSYSLSYNAGEKTTLNSTDDNGYALQQKYNDALAQFNATNEAYDNAQAALNRAKASVEALEANMATGKKAFVDAENAYKAAVAAVEQARLDRETARTILEDTDWEDLFVKAQEAIDLATGKKSDADGAVNRADQAKRNYDNRPIVTPVTPSNDDDTTDGTSSDASDDTSDDTTTTPVAISTVAANTQTGEAVLGENRTPASRAAAASARSNGSNVASTASTNNTNNSSNSAVAGDTNSNATETEADTVDTTTTIADEETAKAATPIETQKSFPYWVLIILAAIAGVSVEEYVRRRNEKVKADDSKKN